MVTILDLMVNVNGGRENLYDHLMNMRIFVESSLWQWLDIHMSSKNHEANGNDMIWIC